MPRQRGPRWTRLSHGVYRPVGDDSTLATLRAWNAVLPRSTIFTGLSAAQAHGLWIPPLPEQTPVFADVPRRATHSTRAGVRVVRPASMPEFSSRGGVLIADVPDCLLACARELGELDLAVLIDAAYRRKLVTPGDMASFSAARRQGAPRLRRALALSHPLSESPWETLLRIIHRCADVQVEPQVNIVDSDGLIGRADLHLVGTQTIHEYDGADHRTPHGHAKDLERDRRLLAAAWNRRGYTAVNVAHGALHIMVEATHTAGQPLLPEHHQQWLRLWEASLFSREGQAAYAARWSPPEKWRKAAAADLSRCHFPPLFEG